MDLHRSGPEQTWDVEFKVRKRLGSLEIAILDSDLSEVPKCRALSELLGCSLVDARDLYHKWLGYNS